MDEQKDVVLFECSISNTRSIRILASAFQCLAKLGKEVSIEAQQGSKMLTLRCVNDAKTSFVSFEFHGDFFDHFEVGADYNMTANIKLRSVLAVFRSVKTIEKLIISLSAMDYGQKHVVVFQSECKHAITKTHHFYYEEIEALDPQFDREDAKHRIRTRPKLLQEAVGHIHGTDEIEVVAMAGIELAISSVHQNLDSNKSVKTIMKIPKNDFEEFDISEPKAKLIFSVREFRSLLSFCVSPGVDISDVFLLFNNPGEPLMFTTASRFEESLMATATGTSRMEDDAMDDQFQRAAGQFSFTLVLSTIPDDSLAQGSQQSQQETSQT